MTLYLHPSYFPNIHTFSLIISYDVCWEVFDNFQKQTYRNRSYIATDQGQQLLSIPVIHAHTTGRQKYRDVKIDNCAKWQRNHWRGLVTAYRSSPFFEYFEDEIAALYHRKFTYLMDFNLHTIRLACGLLNHSMPEKRTTEYRPVIDDGIDARPRVRSKLWYPQPMPEYIQVFGDRHGFLPDLSILDLIFNLGNAAPGYLQALGKSINPG